MIFVNGHGTNIPYLTIVSLRLSIETSALCVHVGALSHVDAVNQVRESSFPGGVSHACEMETSLMLYLDPDHVQMDQARAEMPFPRGKYYWRDAARRAPMDIVGWWSSYSDTGTSGDPTLATRDKGSYVFNAEVERLVEFIAEYRSLEWRPRRDLH
jgi:creatinine amidohydrolase